MLTKLEITKDELARPGVREQTWMAIKVRADECPIDPRFQAYILRECLGSVYPSVCLPIYDLLKARITQERLYAN